MISHVHVSIKISAVTINTCDDIGPLTCLKSSKKTFDTRNMFVESYWMILWKKFFFEFLTSEISEIFYFWWSRILKDVNFGASKNFFENVTTLFYNFPIFRKSISIKRTNPGVRTTFRKKVSAEKLKISPATYRSKITTFT